MEVKRKSANLTINQLFYGKQWSETHAVQSVVFNI